MKEVIKCHVFGSEASKFRIWCRPSDVTLLLDQRNARNSSLMGLGMLLIDDTRIDEPGPRLGGMFSMFPPPYTDRLLRIIYEEHLMFNIIDVLRGVNFHPVPAFIKSEVYHFHRKFTIALYGDRVPIGKVRRTLNQWNALHARAYRYINLL